MNQLGTPDVVAPVQSDVGVEWTGRLAQGIAHELANLLMVVSARSRFAIGALPADSEASAHLSEVVSATARASLLVRHLARADVGPQWKPQLLDINNLVARLEPVLASVLPKRFGVRVTLSANHGVAFLDGPSLERTLLDVAFRHADSAAAGEDFVIETSTRDLDDRIRVAFNTGPADATILMCVSSRALCDASSSLDAILRHWSTSVIHPTIGWNDRESACARLPLGAGYLLIEQRERVCLLSLYIPSPSLSEELVAPPREHSARRSTHAGASDAQLAYTVLVADDQTSIRKVIIRALRGRGYALLEAGDGESALALADMHGAAIHVLVTDMNMPGMNGRELARALRARHPGLLTVFLSGTDVESITGLDSTESAGFLAKPFDPAALVQIVATLLERATA